MSELERLDDTLGREGVIWRVLDGQHPDYTAAHNAFADFAELVEEYRDLLAIGERVASYRDTDGFVKLHGSTMLDERGPGTLYLVVPIENLDSAGQTQVSEPNGERVEPDYGAAAKLAAETAEADEREEMSWLEWVTLLVDAAVGGRLLVDPPKEEESG